MLGAALLLATSFAQAGTAAAAARCELPAWARGAIVYGVGLPLYGPQSLRAVRRQLPQIAALGATVVWLSPVTGAPPGDFGYAMTDPLHVRPALGTEADLRELVRAAHARGLRVILDMVVNHLSDQHPYSIDAHRNGTASAYYDWFERDGRGRVVHYFDWQHLDNLNYADPAVRRYVIASFTHWLREAGVDGFRVDASWAVREREPEFWPRWCAALERIDPHLLLIAEGSATDPYFLSHGFNAVYDWSASIGEWAWTPAFDGRGPLPDLARLRAALRDTDEPGRVLRFLDDNDTGARFVTRHGLAETKLAAAMLLTLPGLPLIYDGDEVGAQFEPYDGRPIGWQDRYGLRPFYERLGRLRRATPALRSDRMRLVASDHDDTVLAYLRPGRPAVLVVLNWAGEDTLVRLADDPELHALAAAGVATDLLSGGTIRVSRDAARSGAVALSVPAHRALVLGYEPGLLGYEPGLPGHSPGSATRRGADSPQPADTRAARRAGWPGRTTPQAPGFPAVPPSPR